MFGPEACRSLDVKVVGQAVSMPSPRRTATRRARSASPPAPPLPSGPVRQWRLTAGDIGKMALREVSHLPEPAFHEITVEVKACGLNFADVFACLGLYSATPSGEFTPGLEFSGVVVAKGREVTSFAVGDRVYGVTRFGGYATRLNISAVYCRDLPNDWSFEEGAAYPAQALTAYYGLVKLGAVEKGKTVLVHSAAGGTGLWCVHFCLALGAKVVGTVGSRDKVAVLCQQTGIPESCVIVRDEHTTKASKDSVLKRAASQLGSYTFDVVFDSLMGDWFDASHAAVGKMGRHVVLGAGAMTPAGDSLGAWDWLRLGWQYVRRATVDPLNMISENKSVMAFNLIWLYENTDMVAPLFDELDKLTAKIGKPFVSETLPFDQAPQALRRFQTGRTVGKVVLKVLDVAA
jgi:NADPH:quinone reductase-like Zn-dependent oxidoreductase